MKARTVAKAGAIIPQRPQPFPSMLFIAAGAVRVARDGMDMGEFYAPASIEIPASTRHLFVTIEPATMLLEIHNLMSLPLS